MFVVGAVDQKVLDNFGEFVRILFDATAALIEYGLVHFFGTGKVSVQRIQIDPAHIVIFGQVYQFIAQIGGHLIALLVCLPIHQYEANRLVWIVKINKLVDLIRGKVHSVVDKLIFISAKVVQSKQNSRNDVSKANWGLQSKRSLLEHEIIHMFVICFVRFHTFQHF